MSTYVCSDIHGRYDRYNKLLEKIDLQETDKLYVLGDVIDRGTEGIEILQDIMKRANVELLLGNHEYMMLNSLLSFLEGVETRKNIHLSNWLDHRNGGIQTLDKFLNLSDEDKADIIQFLLKLSVIKVISLSDRKIHLSHSYTIKDLQKENYGLTDVSDKQLFEIVWKSPFRNDKLFVSPNNYRADLTYIVGHVPVQKVAGEISIIQAGNIINVDCGCAYGSDCKNYLGCLRLDDLEDFYID